jgi:hypothetical protein
MASSFTSCRWGGSRYDSRGRTCGTTGRGAQGSSGRTADRATQAKAATTTAAQAHRHHDRFLLRRQLRLAPHRWWLFPAIGSHPQGSGYRWRGGSTSGREGRCGILAHTLPFERRHAPRPTPPSPVGVNDVADLLTTAEYPLRPRPAGRSQLAEGREGQGGVYAQPGRRGIAQRARYMKSRASLLGSIDIGQGRLESR